MARPKGSKDKRPRKPRGGTGPTPVLPVEALLKATDPKLAPNGLTVRGFPRVRKADPRTSPKTPQGAKALQEHLIANGLLPKDAEMPRDPGGRPMIELDPEEVKSLAKFGPTREEMMAHFKVSGTVLDRYRKEIEEGRELGRLLIRKRARILAMEGNVPMLLHACKHALGERDSGGTTNIAIMGPGQVPQGVPGAYLPNMLAPDTADILAREFMRICPDPALVAATVVLDKPKEVEVA